MPHGSIRFDSALAPWGQDTHACAGALQGENARSGRLYQPFEEDTACLSFDTLSLSTGPPIRAVNSSIISLNLRARNTDSRSTLRNTSRARAVCPCRARVMECDSSAKCNAEERMGVIVPDSIRVFRYLRMF